MLIQRQAGIWLPLSDKELTRIEELLSEIADEARTAAGSKRHVDLLVEYEELVEKIAVEQAVAATEGPQAVKRWPSEPPAAGYVLAVEIREIVGDLWRRWRERSSRKTGLGKVVSLKDRRAKKGTEGRRTLK